MSAFAKAFLERWRGAAGAGQDGQDLLDTLEAARARATAAWPSLPVPLAALAEELAGRVEGEPRPADVLAQLNVEELALTVACAHKDRAALAIFEAEYAPDLRATIERLGFDSTTVDEAEQNVRETLFVATEGRRPGILGFGGHGRLRGWLRVVASRAAFRLARGRQPLPFEEATHQIAGTDDVEIEYLKRTYGSAFESAFREALASLSVPDRLLLKQRFQLGMTVAELGELHGVHASTVSRRVTEARERLAAATRQKMMDRLGLGAKEMSSVLRLIQSQIDISLTSVDGRDRRDLPG